MFDSQTIQMYGTASVDLYSPWFPRGGDYGLFTLEVMAFGGTSPTITVTLIQKNTSDPGNGDPVPGNITTLTLSAVDRKTIDFKRGAGSTPFFQGFEELVRYKFTLSGGADSVTSWMTFRMLPPVWYDAVASS